jgi:ribosomal-protein-serine acetyltransferase
MNTPVYPGETIPTLPYPVILSINGRDDVCLRLTTAADAPQLYSALINNRDHLQEFQHMHVDGISPQSVEAVVKKTVESMHEGTRLQYRIINDERIIGNVNFFNIDAPKRSAFLAYWIDQGYQGTGIVSAGCRSLIDYGFTQLGLEKIMMEIVPENRRSENLARRLGAKLLENETTTEQVDGREYKYRLWEIQNGE